MVCQWAAEAREEPEAQPPRAISYRPPKRLGFFWRWTGSHRGLCAEEQRGLKGPHSPCAEKRLEGRGRKHGDRSGGQCSHPGQGAAPWVVVVAAEWWTVGDPGSIRKLEETGFAEGPDVGEREKKWRGIKWAKGNNMKLLLYSRYCLGYLTNILSCNPLNGLVKLVFWATFHTLRNWDFFKTNSVSIRFHGFFYFWAIELIFPNKVFSKKNSNIYIKQIISEFLWLQIHRGLRVSFIPLLLSVPRLLSFSWNSGVYRI